MTAPSNHLRSMSGYLRKRIEQQTSRRLGVAKILRETPDATNIELAKIFDVDRDTIAGDRKFLMAQVTQNAMTETDLMREDQLDRIAKKIEEIETDHLLMGAAEKHLALWRWMKLETELKGTARPTRSENVNVNVDAENIGPYRQFVLACRGLDAERVERLLTMAREMPRRAFVQVAPPKSSPLWDAPQLGDGDATS
jgi:hypothetical protein